MGSTGRSFAAMHGRDEITMLGYGKMSGCGVAAMSALAECHGEGVQLSSQQIAESRNLSQPLVAKVLTVLSQAGLVHGTRGPGGGYRLARHPSKITLFDVVDLFEGHRDPSACPFGPGWCGTGAPCPLHHLLADMSESAASHLKKANFGSFVGHGKPAEKP
ncbi:Rrf2 family transcriptional regulator [Luteolibacter arcticus]|uniref:Rrf2 family transcriptional regulator n=1 Tax=Luteolibacter arcticus TaxID=1581411 RepID=A0ABT3GLP2_9BACT|nr:Rrf2 family transcriptional regulator [Luteolibacter arcticus]MCW1924407.1 Rrf2 family transcriptional regulator [Luteolibacter arcticus]